MSFFYSNVPLVDKEKCPLAAHHNSIAKEFNKRLSGAGPACAWSIFYYADSIFTGMRNTATPQQPLGVNPPEDEWWKVYAHIDLSTAQTGEGNWPLSFAGAPEGANVMNPLNAYIFGRVTSENRGVGGSDEFWSSLRPKMGPWAEGNLFDGLVESSRAVLSNKAYWTGAFRQRGIYSPNSGYDRSKYSKHRKTSDFKYLAGKHDPVYFSKSLFWVGRSSDHFFPEYASNTVYMRYPPAVVGGKFTKYGVDYTPKDGVLKRKNAAKDLLRWVLWVYTYYFRGSEHQRSLFCEKKTWSAPVVEFEAASEYVGQQTFGMKKINTKGPLNVCKVGFDVFSYMTRQNVFAPCLSREPVSLKALRSYDDMGYLKPSPLFEQYRPSFVFKITQGSSDDNFLGLINGFNLRSGRRVLSASSGESVNEENKSIKTICFENYDDVNEIGMLTGGSMYGKAIRVIGDYDDDSFNSSMLFKESRTGADSLGLRNLVSLKRRRLAKHCMSGYYIETNAVDNPNMAFKLKIWGNNKLLHETIIWKRYSYAVNRSYESKAYIYNKIFYFKNPISDFEKVRFEITPVLEDEFTDIQNAGPSRTYKERRESKNVKGNEYGFDKVISFGNPWSNVTQHESGQFTDEVEVPSDEKYTLIKTSELATLGGLENGDAVSIWVGGKVKAKDGTEKYSFVVGGFARGGRPYFVKKGGTEGDYTRIYLSRRRDSTVCGTEVDEKIEYSNIREEPLQNQNKIREWLSGDSSRKVVIGKLQLEDFLFKATLEPLIALKQRPSFQDLYSLLRVTTSRGNNLNSLSSIVGSDFPGVESVGHGFYDSNRIWKNYIKYGSAQNIYGADVVPVSRQKVSGNPLYESVRKFVSSHMRMADRHDLIDYRIEGGRGVLYFRRFNKYLPKKAKATILKHMEPSVEPVGRFYKGTKNINDLSSDNYKPIVNGMIYFVHCPYFDRELDDKGNIVLKPMVVKYMGGKYTNGAIVRGGTQGHIDNSEDFNNQPEVGFYETEGILRSNNANLFPVDVAKNYQQNVEKGLPEEEKTVKEPYSPFPHKSNEWIMFMNSVHYSPSRSSIYKPSVYGDIMGFLNNRCHHRSLEYERSTGIKYDMIRQELLRTPLSPRNTPGPRLQIFLSKSPANLNYVFQTNNPEHMGYVSDPNDRGSISHQLSNVEDYGIAYSVYKYRKSCPAATPKPYKVLSCKLVDSFGYALSRPWHNPSSVRQKRSPSINAPLNTVRVELDRPLDKHEWGAQLIGSGGWSKVNKSAFADGGRQDYRTDENAVVEYLLTKHLGSPIPGVTGGQMAGPDEGGKGGLHHDKDNRFVEKKTKVVGGGYNCKRMMLGDYGASSNAVGQDSTGYRPFGACYPRFYFLKLIPLVGIDSPLESDPYAQMDFYLRALAGQFVMPYNYYNAIGQVGSTNWNFSELASRSSEEDPTAYHYVDPREVSNS